MHKDRIGFEMRQNVLPFVGSGGAAEHPDFPLLFRTPHIAGHTSIDIGLRCHATFLLLTMPLAQPRFSTTNCWPKAWFTVSTNGVVAPPAHRADALYRPLWPSLRPGRSLRGNAGG